MLDGEVRFRILGPLEFERSGTPVDLGSFRQKTLLALLLINPNQVVSTDRILDELWGEQAAGRQNALWVHVSNLRSALEPGRQSRTEGAILLTRPPGYVLNLDPSTYDAAVFERLVKEGNGLLSHDASAAALVFAEALALWRGKALEEFTYESFARAEIDRLESLRLDAVEGRIDADLARGLSHQLIGELQGLIQENPLREHLTAQLMTALYRSRRRAEAIRAYDILENRLRSELGVDTSKPLEDLLSQVLEGDPRLEPTLSPAPLGPEPGLAVRGYELRSQLGTAPYGTIYRAYQPAIGREVAIKVIRPDLANDPGFIRRFETEASLIASLGSTSVVPLYDFWREPNGAYLVEQLFSGGDLAEVAARGPLPAPEVMATVERIAIPLDRAHELGVIHGDVRLEKVLLDSEGNTYLTDFGIGGSPDTTSQADIAGLAVCAAQLLTGRIGPRDGLIADLDPSVAEVVIAATGDPGYSSAGEFITVLGRALSVVPRPVETSAPHSSPYKGLEPFDEADSGDFFGRERLVERMIARLGGSGEDGRFLAVVGPSGSGKSSVVHAGLIPALRAGAVTNSDLWFVATMTPGVYPFESLVRGLSKVASTIPSTLLEQIQIGPSGLRQATDQILPDDRSPLVLVVDQFEELYTMVGDDEREAFIEALVEAVIHARSRLRVVITLRADFYDHPLASRPLGELLRDHTELVIPMSKAELEVAITRPAEAVGVAIEPALLAALTADAASEPGALPMLQYTLTELFERRSAGTMTVGAYDEIGGLTGAIVGRAEALYGALSPSAQSTARHVFLRLVSINEVGSDTRRRALLSELQGLGGRDGDIDEMLRAFARHRLLSLDRDPASRAPTVEIAHESLIGAWARLGSWIDRAREDVLAQRRLAIATAEWANQDRNPDYLMSGASLGRYASWASEPPVRLTPDEQSFLEAAFAQERERERVAREGELRESKLRRRSLALIGLGVVSASVILLAVLAFGQRERARDLAAETAASERARQLVTESGLVARDDPTLARLLAIEAIRATEASGEALPEAMDALHWALQAATVQYPADDSDIPIAVRPHATGPRGVFVLSPARLAELGRDEHGRAFTLAECERYFENTSCPDTRIPIPASLTVGGGVDQYSGLAGGGLSLEGTTVVLTSAWNGDMVTDAEEDLAALGAEMGIEVVYRSHRFDEGLDEAGLGDDPGDIISPGAPSVIFDTAAQRPVVNVGAYLGEAYLKDSYGEHLIALVSENGSSYGIPMALGPKSLIFYNPEAFAGAGYSEPSTWDELIALSDRMVRDGHAPWCLGVFSFDVTGWPATDWLETILLQTEGPEFYDDWTSHRVPFDHPAVVAALEKVGQLAHTPGYLPGMKIEETGVDEAMLLVSEQAQQCWMAPVPDFGPDFFGDAPRSVMLFPSVNPEYSHAMEGGVGTVFTVSDRPEVRAVMRGLASPSWGTAMAQRPTGWFYPSHREFDVDLFTDPIRRIEASAMATANAAGMFRFDASDQMPFEIGFDALLPPLTEYVSNPDASAKETLAEVEAAWLDLEARDD